MKRVALITWSGLPEGAESEQLLLPLLAERGVKARMADWRDSSIDFGKFDLLILRSCWDYHLRHDEFVAWLRDTARFAPILNRVETVLWNSTKLYLRELESQGIAIAPTCFAAAGEELSRRDVARIEGWPEVVVKPAVSASAHKTYRFTRNALPPPQRLTELMESSAFLVQQFVPEIQTRGELSFIYIDGAYSHAVMKRPGRDDFRVQKERGGSAGLFLPSAALVRQANEIAAAVPQVRESLYCRLDAVEKDSRLVLMELELIEPELFLGLAEGAAERFAEAIVRRPGSHEFAADLRR
jgi:glutathione synthase/RimK-type ligase-like ATP-grasp enzyme